LWVDGIHTGVRLGSDDRLCCLVVLGARLDGKKELVALADGYRESAESWAVLLRDLKRRGMRAPELAVGDGALGFWSAVREVFGGLGDDLQADGGSRREVEEAHRISPGGAGEGRSEVR
jgi:transposase-like protein